MILNALKKIRNRFINLDVIYSRFDAMQRQLDALPVSSSIDALHSRLNAAQTEVDALSVCISSVQRAAEEEINKNAKDGEVVVQVEQTRLMQGEAVRIAFIVQHPAIWPTWRSVWAVANEDSRFLVKVILTPFKHPFSSEAQTYDDLRQCLQDEGVPFCPAEFFDVNGFKPHVTFIQNPYEETRPAHLKIDQLRKAGTRIAYIPYGLEMGGGSWNMTAQFDSLLHRSAWRIFARSERHRAMFGKYCRAGNGHVVVTGHPKFDSLKVGSGNDTFAKFNQKIAGRKVVLWTPHFSVGEPATWSTYRLYSECIFTEMRRRKELFLLVRPHPLFFKAMLQHNVWDAEGERCFRQMINESSNVALDESADYGEAFSISHALMTDVGSFLLEYVPTGKPLLYLHHPKGLGMNDDGALVEHLYIASGKKEIVAFIDMVASGNDLLKAQREDASRQFLFGLESHVGNDICQHIYSSISCGDGWSPFLFIEGVTPSANSETYQQSASLTLPEFHDLKEALIERVLDRMPSFSNGIDIGCGDGRFTLALAKYTGKINGYDISPFLVSKAMEMATSKDVRNVQFATHEFEAITPFEKYELVACMDVTSCVINDTQFLRILDKFSLLSMQGGYLLLIDTLSSTDRDLTVADQSGGMVKYRAIDDYRRLITRRGYRLMEEVLIKEDLENRLLNKLFLFTFNDPLIPYSVGRTTLPIL